VLAAAVLILCAATARAAIEFHFEVGTVHSVGDCDGALNDSDPYFIYRVGSSGTTDYRTNDCGGCGGDAAFNQWWTHTVTAAVDKIRARVRDNDDDYDPWGYCTGDCDSDLGGADLTLYDDNAWYSQWTSTGYADGYGGDGDNDCPDTVQIDYRDYYCDNSAPGAPSSLSVTQSGNIYGSLSSTSATWGTASDADSGIYSYEYCIGTSAGACDVKAWTNTGTTRSATYNYSFPQGRYYWSVRAYNNNLSTFSKILRDCSGNNPNYHAAGAVLTDTTGFAVDKTGPTLHQYQSASHYHSTSSDCESNVFYPLAGEFGVTPTYARVHFSDMGRYDLIAAEADEVKFWGDGTVWGNENCSSGVCVDCHSNDSVWSPWDTDSSIGIQLCNHNGSCSDPNYTIDTYEYDRTYGWYRTDPGSTVAVSVYANSETTSFDDSASNRMNIDYIEIDKGCDNSGWVTVWNGSADTVGAFNAWSYTDEGEFAYCVRACDEGGNCETEFDSTALKVKFWYRKDSTPPVNASVSHTDGYETDTTIGLTFDKGTDALSGVATWKIQYRSSPLSLNSCTGYGAWIDLVTDPAGTTYNHVGVTSGYCYQYRIISTDGIGNSATFDSGKTTKIDTTASTGGTISYTDGYRTTTSVSVTLGNGNDPQSDIGTRYLDRRTATLSDNICGSFGAWGALDANPNLNYTDSTVSSGYCYQYRYRVYNNAALLSTYCTDGAACSTINTVKVDTSEPVLGAITASNYEYGVYVSSPFTLSIDAADTQSTVASCEYSKNNGATWFAADSLCNHRVICTDGEVLNLKLRATNEAGLTSTSATLTRTCDTPKPSTADNWTDDWTNSGSVNVTLSILDGGSGMTGGQAGTWYCTDTTNTCTPATAYSTPINFACASGSVCVRYLRYFSRDAVGNTEDVNSERIRQDLQKPATTDDWTNNCSASASPQSPVGIYLNPDDASGSGMSGGAAQTLYCVDTANTCTPGTAGAYVQVYCAYGSQCTQYVRYRSTDYAGNVEATTHSNCVYQDIHQPEWLDQWDPTDDTGAGATTLVPTENTVNTHGPHSLNNYSVNTDNYDWYKAALSTGRRYCFNSIGGIGNVRAQLCSDSACGTVVASDDDSGGYEQFSLCYTPASAGTYYLRMYGNPVGEVWYGDVHYWYTTVATGAPAATTNSSDSSTVTATQINNAPSGGDEWWPCNNGDPDWYALVCLNGSCAGSESNRVENHGLVDIVDVTKTANVGRTETPTTLIEIWDYDNCSGNDLYTCRTWTSAIPTANAWNTLNNCGESNPNLVYVSNSYVDDKGVDTTTGLAVSSTTDTGQNGSFNFSWNTVSDRSGISAYWFQLATDSGFSNLIMSKNMGSSTSVTMGYGVLTPSTTYYWRVGAVSSCTNSSPSKRCDGAYSNATHVSWTSAQSFSMTDDDLTQPDAGNLTPLSSTIFDSNTNYSVFIDTGPHTRTGDDQSETFTCINTGLKSCSMFFAQEPLSGANTYAWDSGYRTADAAAAPSGVEIDEATAVRSGSQIHWYLEDYSTFGEQETIALGDGGGDWEEVSLPEFSAASVDRAGKEDYFVIDRMILKVSLQTTLAEWCSVIWPFSCNPNQTELSMTIQTRRHNGTAWDAWTTRQTVSGVHAWTTREFTLLDTTSAATINSWNTGANKVDVRILLSGTIGANVIETEFAEFYARYAKVTASYDWHINSHSAVQFIPLTQILGTPIEFVCALEDDDNDRGANKDCSPAASLDVDYDCVTGEGSKGRSGACTALNYTVVDDDDTAPLVTLDAPDYINAGPVDIEAGASDVTQGDETGIAFVKFQYAPYSGGCGAYTDIATDSDSPDCDPSYCVTTWSTLPSDGRYCVKAIARDKDDDRANDWLEGYAVDDNVIIDRQPPNNPTMASVVDDNGTCSGAALPDNTWQAISSDPCFTWNAATDNGLSGVASYWVYYGSKCTSVVDGDGGYIGNVLTWTNDVSPGEGTFCFWIKVRDNAGNQSTPVKLWTIRYDGTDPTVNTPDADNTDYNNQYVDATFDISATVSDAGSMLKDNTCEYRCSGDGGLCNGVWRSATDNWSGTSASSGTCSISSVTCTTNAANITMEMRVGDNAGRTGTSVSAARTCDLAAPTCSISSISESAANVYYPGTGAQLWYSNASSGGAFTVQVTAADALSGMQKVNFPSPSSLSGCGDDTASPYSCAFNFTTSTTQNGAVTITSYDNVNNTNTCAYTLTRDITAPAGGSISYTDGWYTTTSVAVSFTNGTDTGSGMASRMLQRREASLQDGTGNCAAFGTWSDLAANPASSPHTDTTVASGKCYQYRYIETDRVGNQATYTSASTAKVDTAAPNAPACGDITLRSASGGSVLTWGGQYNYTAPTGPFMEWTSPGDNPASTNAGVASYWVYFGTNSGADPLTDGANQAGMSFTNSTTLTSGSSYYFKIKAVDRAGNVAATSPSCEYRYTTGGYLFITQFDSDSADDPEGVLEPGGADYELVTVKLMDENDTVISTGPVASKSIDITLGNLGGTGAYISETHQGTTTGSPTTVTVALSAGVGWVKIKAAAPDAQAITVTPTSNGAALSGQGGRDQKVYLLVRSNSTVIWPGGESTEIAGAGDQLIINPVWSHDGSSVAYASFDSSGCNCWNLYARTHTAGAWNASTKLTLDNIPLRAGSGITWSADGQFVIFSAKTSATELDLYAVAANGGDNAKTLEQLHAAGKRLTNVDADNERWADSDWSGCACGGAYASYADSIVSSMAKPPANIGADLWILNGSKTSGLYLESNNTPAQVTALPGYTYAVQPRWAHDCSKIIFIAVDGVGSPSPASVYMIKLSEAALPIASLSAAGVYKIHECSTTACTQGPAIFPSFSADDTMAIYSVDSTGTVDFRGLQKNEDLMALFFTGKNFDNHVTYVAPASPANYVTQRVGESANNEFGLTQCAGASCPNAAGNALTYVTQSATTTGALRTMYLDTESTVTAGGGLMFLKGGVVTVIPSGALHAETRLSATEPASPPASPDGEDLLVSTGDAREFFPDGIVFDKDILMIFHYDDADNNGIIDTGSPGQTLDENKIYVYYWCDAGSAVCSPAGSWIRLDGSIDPDRNTITVATNHFSLYDPKVLTRGALAPFVIRPLHLENPHTYPNPWRSGDGPIAFNIDLGSSFNTQEEGAPGELYTTISIHDMRGALVRTITGAATGLTTLDAALDGSNSISGRGLDLATWDARNSSGRAVASGVYIYKITVSDGIYTRTGTGKLAIIK
jgi:hypothetical protein